MSNRIKWALAGILVLSVVIIAQASALTNIYMPVIYVGPTITPTPIATPKPTECLNQVFFVKEIKVCFTDIVYKPTTSPLDEWVTIKNLGNNSVELEGWRIVSDSSTNFKYDFPKFTLKTGQTVKVWTKVGTNSSSQLYMNRTQEFCEENNNNCFWKDNGDYGYLKDNSRQTINSFSYGTTGLFASGEH
ncbi:MAG: lamin tail domain-containing protein [Anaerolineales bacterium]